VRSRPAGRIWLSCEPWRASGSIRRSIQGTVTGPFPTPAGTVQPTGARLDIPTADFWYIENGKIKEFNCYVGLSVMLAQLGVQPDFAAAVNASTSAAV